MRLSTRRLEALLEAAGRGIDEWESDEWASDKPIEAAREGLRVLYAVLRKRRGDAS